MKTITKKYKKKYQKKRKTMKKRVRKIKYFLKGGDEDKKEEEKEGDKEGDEDKKEGEEGEEGEGEGKGMEIEGFPGWSVEKDSIAGGPYYSIWTLRGKPIFGMVMSGVEFFKGDFKKKMLEAFLEFNPTAVVVQSGIQAGADTALNLIEDQAPKIARVRQILSGPLDAVNAANNAVANAASKIDKKAKNVAKAASAAGGGKRKYSRKRK